MNIFVIYLHFVLVIVDIRGIQELMIDFKIKLLFIPFERIIDKVQQEQYVNETSIFAHIMHNSIFSNMVQMFIITQKHIIRILYK